jgi:WD40 repeat protein
MDAYSPWLTGKTSRSRFPRGAYIAWPVLVVLLGGVAHGQEDNLLGIRTYPAHPYNNVMALAFAPDSRTLYVGSELGKIIIVDVATGREIKTITGEEFVSRFALSPKGNVLAAMRDDFEDVLLWNPIDWKRLPSLRTPKRVPVSSIAFSPDGEALAVGCRNNSIYLWDMQSREIRYWLRGHIGLPDSLSFSPDGPLLASSAPDEACGSSVILWDVKSGDRSKVIVAHKKTTCVAFLPGGTQLASSGIDGRIPNKAIEGDYTDDATVKIWDVASGKLLQTLKGHTNSVKAMVPLPGGKLITGGSDCTVRLWDLATSRELRKIEIRPKPYGDSVQTLVLSPDGKYLACGLISSEGRYKLWKLSEVFPEAVENAGERRPERQ